MIMPIVMACMNMAKGKVGALIVIERSAPLDDIVETGDTINANINQRLIENIFFKNSPLQAVSYQLVTTLISQKKFVCVIVLQWE